MTRRILFTSLFGFFFISSGCLAQSTTGAIRGTITDPSGAMIPSANIVITSRTTGSKSATSGADGSFALDHLVPGRYSASITATGFASGTATDIMVYGGKTTREDVRLQLPVEQQQIQVSAETTSVDTNPDNNASAIVIKGKDLDALSDDPDELQDELTALAGPSAGPSGGQIYIDGFTGGQLPPKSSIREIRINQNPFSAQYDKLGYGRIEILTKPGTDNLHGMFMIVGNDSSFNSLNPFVTTEPPYYSTFMVGNASGSLSKTASLFGNVFYRNNQSNSIINAEVLDTNGTPYNYTAAVPNPQTRLDISPRLDFQLGANNTLSVRYMFDRQQQTNSGVSQFALESQAYNVSNNENTIQISDTQVLGDRVVNETKFEYIGDRNNQVAQNTTPTVTVQGAFTGGGNNDGTVRDSQDHYEFLNYTTAALGKHALNFGGRLRLTHDSNYTTSGFNGNFIYSSLNAYTAGTPSEYNVTVGKPKADVNVFDAGLFFQDDYKTRSNLTLSFGLRFEGQNRISNHADWAPRFSFAWAPGRNNGHPATTVIRGGYGWFFDRFSSTYVLDTIHQNGINQQQYVVKNPDFTEPPGASTLTTQSSIAPTIYQLAPNVHAQLNMEAAVGVEHQFGKIAKTSVTYVNSHGDHQYLSNNVNAFLPGTYDPTTGAGVRPNGINENIYQFQSAGVYNQNQLMVNYSVRTRRASLFGFYMLNFAKADTSGPTYFPANPYDTHVDYGRATFDVHNRFLLGGNIQAPYGVSISPFLVYDSGTPFDITVGQDLNGDNQYNDRPAYATEGSPNSVTNRYGTFNLNPSAFEARIPYNVATGPSLFSMNLRVSKSFGIGPRIESASGGASGGPGGGPPPGGGGPPGGGAGGGGLGPGGLSGSGGPPRLEQALPRRYTLTFAAMGRNVFNHVNLAQPVGVLESPLFGTSNALAGGFFSSPAANRSIDLQMTFSF